MARLEINTYAESRCSCGYGFVWDDRNAGLLKLSQLRQEQHETLCSEAPFGRWKGHYIVSVYGACKAENAPWS